MSLFLRISSFSLIIGSLWTQCVAQTKLDPNNPVYSAFYTVEQATEFPKDEVPVYEKAPGAVLLSTNFANTLGSWTTSGSNGAVWQHDDDGPSGQFSVAANEIIASQSINNGFAIFDADLSNPGPGPWQARSGALVSPAFSMTGVTSAFVEFYQKYRFCCDASFFPKLEVSNNDFLTFAIFDASIPNVGSGIISPTEFSKINITAFLDTATDLSAVKIRFNFQGTSQATHYYWQIDDVKVKEAFLYDLNIQSFKMGMGQMQLPYYFMPITQVSPVTFYGSVLNEGSLEGENVHLEVNLDQGGGSTTSDSVLLQPLESASFSTYTLTPPSVWNFYTVTYDFVQDSVEGYPIDNSSTEILSVFDHLYSIDKNEASGYISNVSTQVGQPFKIGNVMEVLQDDVIDSMHIIITGTQSNIDQQIYGELRKKVNGSWQLIESTQPVWITWDNYTQSIGLRFWNIVKCPLAAPSANKSKSLSPTTAKHVAEEFGNKLKMIIDGGVCKVGIESTVIDLTTKPKILREGGLSSEVIEKFLKMKLFENKNKIIKSPGQIGLHYSPGMPIYMNREKATKDGALITFGNKNYSNHNYGLSD